MSRIVTVGLILATVTISACSDNEPPTGPTTGSITVTVTTTGEDLPTGFTVILDGGTSRAVDANGTTTFTSVSAGTHEVELSEVPGNCAVTSGSPASVTVNSGSSKPVSMTVTCSALVGAIEVTVSSTGDDVPDGYVVAVDGGVSEAVSANGSVTFEGLAVGSHEVELTEVPANCTVVGANPVTVAVSVGQAVQVLFTVECSQSSMIAFQTFRDGERSEIFIMNSDGTGERNLTNDPGHDYEPVWSPDGSRIAFLSFRDGTYQVYAMNADGSNPFVVADDLGAGGITSRMPRWSPDGSRLAFWSDGEVYVVNADGTDLANVTQTPFANDFQPVWSHDGTRLAFVRQGGTDGIYVVNADGTGLARITDGPADREPAWSPVDDRIVFSAFDGELYSVNPNGGELTNLTNTAEVSEHNPIWSPDGTRLAFERSLQDGVEIYVMVTDGSSVARVTDSPADNADPTWSPDGTRLAFWSNRDGNSEIYSVSVDGSGLLRLTDLPGEDLQPRWSP